MITIQIASIPTRKHLLKETIKSLKDQCDILNVFLNSYKEIPEYFKDYSNITGKLLDNSTGDAAKFYGVENLKGYILTCDDDLIYPKDYVKIMISQIDKYKCIISNHGRILFPRPIGSYYRHKVVNYHCILYVEKDHKVEVGGTGVMGFHSDHFKIKYSDFKLPNMADVFVAIKAWRKVDIIVNAHCDSWIKTQKVIEPQIWDLHVWNDFDQTDLINKHLI